MRALLLARYGDLGASSRLRLSQYVPALAALGIASRVEPLLPDAYVQSLYRQRPPDTRVLLGAYVRRLRELWHRHPADVVWLEKEALPWVPAWAERAATRLDVPVVVDIDDAVFHRYDLHSSSVVRRLLGRKIDDVFAHAEAVTAGSAYLAERARAAGAKQVHLVPTVVDLARYPLTERDAGVPFTIGWIGSPVTQGYLAPLRDVLGAMLERGARVILVGASDAALAGLAVERRPWHEDREAADIASFDVGIMPLADTPWERGKCAYKIVQYMASGRAVAASPIGANRAVVTPGVDGLLPANEGEWLAALTRLSTDRGLAARMGRAGRAKAEREYSLQVQAPRVAAILRAAVRGAAGAASPAHGSRNDALESAE